MSQVSKTDQLLTLAFLFQKEALFALNDLENNFTTKLSEFLNKSILQTDILDWFEANKNILSNYSNIFSKKWTLEPHKLWVAIGVNNKKEILFAEISKQPNIDKDHVVVESSVLQPSKNIEKLFFSIVKYEKETETENNYTTLDLSHNAFIVESILFLFKYDSSPELLNEISEFISTNKEKINKIRNLFDSQPSILGAGEDGVAFSINPKMVLKIFFREFSYKEALKAQERLHKNPDLAKTEAMIYDVGVLGTWRNKPLYYYIMEKMKPIENSSKDDLGLIINRIAKFITNENNSSKLKTLKQKINDPKIHATLKKEVTSFSQEIVNYLKTNFKSSIFENVEKSMNLKPSWLQSLAEEILMKILTKRMDLHLGNLGVTNYGELRYFDPAYYLSTSELNVPEVFENEIQNNVTK